MPKKLGKRCIDCGKEIDDRATRCKSCAQHQKIDKKSPGYKHGLSRLGDLRVGSRHRNRNFTIDYAKWTKEVFKRDNWKCQHCSKNKKLRAHHIYSYSKYPKLRLNVVNGITLCEYHHRQLHQLFGVDVAPKQLKWFLRNVK